MAHPFTRLLKPLNLSRLKPFRQSIKHGTVAVTDQNSAMLKFDKENFEIEVASDGETIKVKLAGGSVMTHTIYSLPGWISKRFDYISQFVSLVRSKTPLLILITSQFKALLMENGPPADFKMQYHTSKVRLDFSAEEGLLSIRHPDRPPVYIKKPDYRTASSFEDTDTRVLVSEFISRYNQCTSIGERALSSDGFASLPYVIDERPRRAASENYNENNRMSTIHMNTFEHSNYVCEEYPSDSFSKKTPFDAFKKTFIPTVGWCLVSTCEMVLMLFCDGFSLVLDSRSSRLAFSAGKSTEHRWKWYSHLLSMIGSK